MKFDVLIFFFEFFDGLFWIFLLGCVIEFGLVDVGLYNICDNVVGKYCIVDDLFYGGGVGMVMMVELIVIMLEVIQG